MKPILAVPIALLLLAGVGVAVYPSAHGSYVRYRATAHMRDADALEQQMRSPVAKQALTGSSDRLKFAAMQASTPVEDIAKFDDARMADGVAESLTSSYNPLEVTAVFEPGVAAGGAVTIQVSVHSLLPEVFLVNVTAQIDLPAGWRSSPARQVFNRTIDGTRIDTPLEIRIPADVAGQARVRATATYRLDPSGEGIDLRAQPASTPPLTITRGRQ